MRWMKQALLHGLRTGFLVVLLGVAAANEAAAAFVETKCPVNLPGARQGHYICEYGYSAIKYGGRFHVFLTGLDKGIYYNWQTRPGGPSYQLNWTRLGQKHHQAISSPLLYQSRSAGFLAVSVIGTDFNQYCNRYTPGGPGWGGWVRC